MNPLDVVNTQLVRVRAWIDDLLATDRHDERGNLTMEQALWAGVIIAVVGIVAAALKAFIETALAALH